MSLKWKKIDVQLEEPLVKAIEDTVRANKGICPNCVLLSAVFQALLKRSYLSLGGKQKNDKKRTSKRASL